MKQLAIDLPPRTAFGRADFLVSDSNAAALERIERWPDWPATALVLHGPARSGKTHLARLWCERSGAHLLPPAALATAAPDALAAGGAVAVDDADAADERALLHLFNCCRDAGAGLLIVASVAPGQWPIALPDLGSRLRAAPAVGITAPDDTLLAAVLVKAFADRQLRVGPEVIGFLVRRMERSFAAAAALADRLDRHALSLGRPVTVALARQVFAEHPVLPGVDEPC